jgi:K+-sensing histidine kinase KdpD
MDLQAAFVLELVTDPEVRDEVKKLRAMVSTSAKMLQTVSGRFWVAQPNFITVAAKIVFEDFRDRLARLMPEEAPQISWTDDLQDEQITVDLEMFFSAAGECFQNAVYFRAPAEQKIHARIFADAGQCVLEITQPVKEEPDTSLWGRAPLVTTRRGGYGLGLYHARQLFTLHGGDVEFRSNPEKSAVVSRITLPLAVEGAG